MKQVEIKLLETARLENASRRIISSSASKPASGAKPAHDWSDIDRMSVDSNGGCRHVTVLPGYGKRDYPFPSADELVARAIAYFNELSSQHAQAGSRLEIGPSGQAAEEGDVLNSRSRQGAARLPASLGVGSVGRVRTRFGLCTIAEGTAARSKQEARNKSSAPAAGVAQRSGKQAGETAEPGSVVRIAAGTIAHIMEMGKDEAAIARTFDPLRGGVNWALYHMPAGNRPDKYKDTAESLRDQLDRLIDVERQAVPRMKQFLKAQFPDASDEEILDAAISLLNEQLRDILTVLSIWTESFAQLRDGLYPELSYLQFMMSQVLRLFHTGDALAREKTGIKTQAFHLDDLFMARYSDQGPAAIPGSRGPVGAHMIMTPMYERRISIIDLPIYGHEFFHPFYFDVQGLANDMTTTVIEAIQKAGAEGRFKFSSDTTTLGKQSVPTLQLMVQLFGQTLSEKTADVVGGVSLTGEAYGYSVLSVFGAFNLGGDNAVTANHLLRHSSVYAVGKQGELVFEPHMPDIIRILAVSATLENRGFSAEAQEFRLLAEQAGGFPLPTHAVWRNINPRSPFKFEIKLSIEDLKQVMAVVVDAILSAKLDALNGLCMSDLVNWTPKRQEKVDALVANLVKGSAEIPWQMGDFYAPYIAAAAIKAVWSLWKSGALPPLVATDYVEYFARKMMDQLKLRFEQMEEAAATACSAAAGEPKGEAVPESDATGGGAGDGAGDGEVAAEAATAAGGDAGARQADVETPLSDDTPATT